MRAFLIIFIVLLLFLWKPQLLYSFDSLSGRLLMLLVVVYLAKLNVLLGFVAALVMVRAMDKDPKAPFWEPSVDLMDLETLLRPKNSATFPTLRTGTVPVNDFYEPYTPF